MADRKISSSSSSSSSNFTYDVFLSFRGKDIRKTFVDHLYTALLGSGLSTFRDDDEIDRGENITSEVETAISRSKSSIIVFSKDYASSTWCLDELVLILQRKVTSGLIVLPIFYDIDPSSIRRQTGRVSQAFDRHEERFKTEADDREREYWMNKVKEWSTALTEVANLRGMVLQNEADGELNFIKKVVTVILDKVTSKDLNVTPYLVGLDDQVKNIRAAEVEKVSITVQHCIRALSSILTHVTMRETEDKLALELQRCIDSLRSLEKLILPDHSSLAAFPMFHGAVAIRTSPTSNKADWMETNIEVPKGTSARSDDSKSLSLIGKGKLEEASSLEELKQIVKAVEQITEVLNRMKDFLLLILSYPMKPEANVDFGFLCSTFSQINGHVRGLEAKIDHQSEHKLGNLLVYREILEHFLVAAELLVKCNFDFLAYLPRDFLSAPPQVIYNLATSSAISQASKYVKDGTFNRIGISGTGGTNVIDGLKNLPEIRSLFNVVLCISISEHHNDIEIEREIVQQINLCKTSIGGTENSLLLLKVLLLLDCIDESVNLYNLHTPDELIMGFPIQLQTVLTTRSHKAYQIMPVDLEIRIEDHLLPWDLFCRNVGQVMANFPIFQHIIVQFIEKCNRHLLAIILLGRSLKGITDVSIWDITLCELTKLGPQVEGTNEVMIFVLKFIWDRKDRIAQHCIKKYCTSQLKGTKCNKALLMDHWIADRVIENRQQGEVVLEDLIDSFLLENLDGDSVRMREEIRDVLLGCIPQPNALHLNLGGLKLTETPKAEEWDAKEINLMNNKFSELPDNPKCPVLAKLSLQSNYELTEIPEMFFESMPVLQVLDISNTSIKSLNVPSISRLVELQVLLLRSCELLMELPPQIGALRNLKVLDVEGTELVYLPKELGELINLECLKVSLYGSADSYSESKEIDEIIPRATLSKLTQLKELSINVDPDGEWWNFEVKTIFEELPSLSKLENLKLYLPTTELLQQFLQLEWNMNGLPIYPNLVNFRLIVGPRKHRVVSRIPLNLEEEFLELEKCMKFINGEGSTNQFGEALKHVNALFLDCHWTIEKLSVVKIEYLNELKVCLLVDCNEMKTIFEGHDFYQGGSFGSLQYLGIHYLKNLEFIWKGPVFGICLPLLQILALHMCPNLTTIFTPMLLQNLVNLEEITVEDCPKVKTLVVLDSSNFGKSDQFLPRLKKISLLDLPELINISNGLHIAPKLERMFIYNCPKLKILYPTELCNKSIIEIKGESEWWNALEWREPEWSSGLPDYLHHAFSPLAIDVGDLMDQLAISGTSLKTLYVRSKSFARARIPTFQAKGIRKVSNDLEISPEEFPLGCYKSTSQDAEQLDKGVNEQSPPLYLGLSRQRSPLPNQSPKFQKMVLKLEIHNDKEKKKAMKAAYGLPGIESIAMDMKNKKLTVIGDVDPIAVVHKLRKLCHAELLTIGPAKEPEKKDEKKDVDKKKDQNDRFKILSKPTTTRTTILT